MSDSEDEVFFGPVSVKECIAAKKVHSRRTEILPVATYLSRPNMNSWAQENENCDSEDNISLSKSMESDVDSKTDVSDNNFECNFSDISNLNNCVLDFKNISLSNEENSTDSLFKAVAEVNQTCNSVNEHLLNDSEYDKNKASLCSPIQTVFFENKRPQEKIVSSETRNIYDGDIGALESERLVVSENIKLQENFEDKELSDHLDSERLSLMPYVDISLGDCELINITNNCSPLHLNSDNKPSHEERFSESSATFCNEKCKPLLATTVNDSVYTVTSCTDDENQKVEKESICHKNERNSVTDEHFHNGSKDNIVNNKTYTDSDMQKEKSNSDDQNISSSSTEFKNDCFVEKCLNANDTVEEMELLLKYGIDYINFCNEQDEIKVDSCTESACSFNPELKSDVDLENTSKLHEKSDCLSVKCGNNEAALTENSLSEVKTNNKINVENKNSKLSSNIENETQSNFLNIPDSKANFENFKELSRIPKLKKINTPVYVNKFINKEDHKGIGLLVNRGSKDGKSKAESVFGKPKCNLNKFCTPRKAPMSSSIQSQFLTPQYNKFYSLLKPSLALSNKPQFLNTRFRTPTRPHQLSYGQSQFLTPQFYSHSTDIHKNRQIFSACKSIKRPINSPIAKYLQNNPPPPLITTVKPKYKISPQKSIAANLVSDFASESGRNVNDIKKHEENTDNKKNNKENENRLCYSDSVLKSLPMPQVIKHKGRMKVPKATENLLARSSMMEVSVYEAHEIRHTNSIWKRPLNQ